MGSSTPLVHLLLTAIATRSAASATADLARPGVGVGRQKGRAMRGGAKGSTAATKTSRTKQTEKQKSTPAPAPAPLVAPLADLPVTPYPTDDETYAPSPEPSALLADVVVMVEAAEEVPALIADDAPGAGQPPCPPEYDPAYADYAAGDTVAMDAHVFVCQAGEYEAYCGVAAEDPAWDEVVKKMWENAWYHVEPCRAGVPGPTLTEIAATVAAAVPAATVADPAVDPAALYDDDDWQDLPGDVQHNMADLGYTADLWDGDGVVTTDDLDWDELDAAEQGAAAALGYDEEVWMADAASSATPSRGPTAHPTHAAILPTYTPTATPPPCPPSFTPQATYGASDVVEVEEHIFQCNAAGEGLYVKYCNILHWDEELLEDDLHAQELWEGAWVHLGSCLKEDTPLVEDYMGAARR